MKNSFSTCISFLMAILMSAMASAQDTTMFKSRFTTAQLQNAPAKLIPFPQKVEWNNVEIEVFNVRIKNADQLSEAIRKELKSLCERYGIAIDPEATFLIDFKKDTAIPKEGYHFNASNMGVFISSNGEAGQFYALQTLRQLIRVGQGKIWLQSCLVYDAPKYAVRGYMLDVGRNYQSLASLKKQLDIMAMYKMNVFHWHLTDRPAWRIESKKYPELTNAKNHRPTRNPGMYYTYDQIRELIAYAREKQIRVIPEIDMPGHSDSFEKAMGCKMDSEQGMLILENVLQEFFEEIPETICPIIHIGSDEVHIKNPKEFISKMVSIGENNDREVIVWNPGLEAKSSVIRQTWDSKHREKKEYKEIDSWDSYINNGEPMTIISKLFFKPIGYGSSNHIIGGIICMWPDVKLEKEEDFIAQNPLYPSLLTYAWATWTADVVQAPTDYFTKIPAKGTVAYTYFTAFEDFLLDHKQRFFANVPFQYIKQTDKEWLLSKPFSKSDADSTQQKLIESQLNIDTLQWKKAIGNTLIIKDRFKLGGYYPDGKVGETVFAMTNIYVDEDKDVKAWIGFESPMRANRTYTGIARQGNWDSNGGKIWVNGEQLPAPIWKNPGWKPSKINEWGAPEDQETPWTKEELYWTRDPTVVSLKKGKNTIVVKIPSTTDYQNWMFTFIPLKMDGLHFKL